jgi:hypothetical protein
MRGDADITKFAKTKQTGKLAHVRDSGSHNLKHDYEYGLKPTRSQGGPEGGWRVREQRMDGAN